MAEKVDALYVRRADEMDGGRRIPHIAGGTRKMGRLAGGVRDKLTMAEMKTYIAALWKNGDTYIEIADRVSDQFGLEGDLRMKPNSVSYHIKQMLEDWKARNLLSVDDKMALSLARYEQLEALASEAYFLSMEGKSIRGFEKQIQRARSNDRKKDLSEEIYEEKEGELDPWGRRAGERAYETDGGLADTLVVAEEKIKRTRRNESSLGGNPKFLAILVDINYKRTQLWGLISKKNEINPDHELAKLSDEARRDRLMTIINQARMRKTGDMGNLAPASPLGGFQEGEEPKAQMVIVEPSKAVPEDDDDWGFDTNGDDLWD